jgi:hypothetical protein
MRRSRRGWWLRLFRNTLLFVGLAAGVGWSVGFQRAYGTCPGTDVGDRINWCNRAYKVAVTDLTDVEANQGLKGQLETLFSYPPHLPRRDVLGVPVAAPGCPEQLFIRTGPDRYTKYLPDQGATARH